MAVRIERSTVVAILFAWACLLAVYLLFAGQASSDEIVAGSGCASAAVLWWIATRGASEHTFAFESGSWAAVGRACRNLPWATISVGAVLLRTLTGREQGEVSHRFYTHGRHADPNDSGRRAVGVLATSLAPDSFVLRTPADRDEIVIHGLPVSEAPADPRWPI